MSNAVTVRPIYTDADLDAALARLDEIFDADPGTPEGDERNVLATLIHAYEEEHHPVDGPVDPVDALRFHVDRLGLRPKDLIPYLGTQPRVSEVLAGKRRLTVEMIRNLHLGLGVPAEDLIGSKTKTNDEAARKNG